MILLKIFIINLKKRERERSGTGTGTVTVRNVNRNGQERKPERSGTKEKQYVKLLQRRLFTRFQNFNYQIIKQMDLKMKYSKSSTSKTYKNALSKKLF